ncbi:gfo/Idh/MocA family oxidoreductase, partial [Escherichia coli]
YYCLASALALWGEPKSVLASASLLPSGVDAHGTVCLNYGDFDVVIIHSKVSQSDIPSEIQGEDGSLVIESISECLSVAFTPRGSHSQDLTQPQHINTMLYEAEVFANLVEANQVEHDGLQLSLLTSRIQTDI